MSAITCCRGCKHRYVGCHSKCETYKQQKAEYERLKLKAKQTQRPLIYTADYEMLKCMHCARKDNRRR